MQVRGAVAVGLMLAVSIGGCSRSGQKEVGVGVAKSALAIHPALIGSAVPPLTLYTPEGRQQELRAVLAQKPTVLVVYKGNWCIYCLKQLADLQKIEPDLLALGYQIVGLSPDLPSELRKTVEKRQLNYTLLSDFQMQAARALGLAYYVDEATRRELERRNVEFVGLSVQPGRMLPVPAVFIVDTRGIIRWQYVNPDYTERVPTGVLLAAARCLAEKK
ncbi:MAG: AhpC/TSA family protein [Planctomycetes bacterium]|nr:AhpC/TSA family protein [Planctomycetota bacterium]